MRLNEIRMIITENIKYLPCELVNDNKNPNMKGLNNIASIMNAVNAIGNIPYFVKLADEIQSINEISSVHTDGLTWFSNNIAVSFKNKVDLMSRESATILRFINSFIPQMDKSTICVKLPDNITASEFKTIIDSFAIAFDIITKSEDRNDEVTLIGVETGSAWLSYLVIGGMSLSILKRFIQAALDIYEQILRIKKLRLELQELEDVSEHQNSIEEIREKAIEKYLSKIQKDININLDGDLHTKYLQALKSLVKILETKTTIQLSITAPKEEAAVYIQKLTKIDSLTNGIQLLEAATVSDDSIESVQDSQDQQEGTES